MLMAVKNQFRISILSIKYALQKEMLNKTTFITNIIFMILNNASFIVQWVVLFSIRNNIAGYHLKQVLLLWGLASGVYGISHFFFKNSYGLSDTINTGLLDTYLVQPKNVLLSSITTNVEPSAIGDILYAYIILIIVKAGPLTYLLWTFLIICGGLIVTSFAVMAGSLSFWLKKSDIIAEKINSLAINFATYPDGIFKGVTKILLYTIIPVGFANYIPLKILLHFNPLLLSVVIAYTIMCIILAFLVFNKGLKRYSSTNLMNVRL